MTHMSHIGLKKLYEQIRNIPGQQCVDIPRTERTPQIVLDKSGDVGRIKFIGRSLPDDARTFYQPIITLESGDLIGFEALVRWRHPQKGLLEPGEFIKLAEETGIILDIDYWVLSEACKQIQCWNKKYNPQSSWSISINFSGKHFGDPGLPDKIKRIIFGNPCPGDIETTNVENFNGILRERNGRLVRKTKCFSKLKWRAKCSLLVFQFHWNFINKFRRGSTPGMLEGIVEKPWTWDDFLMFHNIFFSRCLQVNLGISQHQDVEKQKNSL